MHRDRHPRPETARQGGQAALLGIRRTDDWTDTVYLDGFSRGCYALRERTTSLVAPGHALVEHRTTGDALNVTECGHDVTTAQSLDEERTRVMTSILDDPLASVGVRGLPRTSAPSSATSLSGH